MKFVCEFVGGSKNGSMSLAEALNVAEGWSHDWSAERARGCLVPREELDNKPKFREYAGPMWDGEREGGIAVLRYESWPVYEMMSR